MKSKELGGIFLGIGFFFWIWWGVWLVLMTAAGNVQEVRVWPSATILGAGSLAWLVGLYLRDQREGGGE